jgi:hypothetical protein
VSTEGGQLQAIAAILREGIHASGDQWTHAFVQSQFTEQLINRQHRYPAPLRSSLIDLHLLPGVPTTALI